ncbi:MAG: hypothetical protein K2P81_11310 [Bacteriovoracaceae bacterium]|nr:hypothetical protein [Bacteriovoracaceae bacterium]
MKLKNKIMTLVVLMVVAKAQAFEQIYYGDGIKDVLVNSQEPSLLVFPSPPIARVCHPSGVVDFFPIENTEQDQIQSLNSLEWNQTTSGKATGEGTERMLKLRPYQDSQSTLCDIKLANKETATIRFKTSPSIKRPSIEFINVFSKASRKEARYSNDSLQVFQNFISGGELIDFYDITTSKESPVSKKTKLALYEVSYIGTDRDKYKVWRINTIPQRDSTSLPELQKVQLNQLYFSAWKSLKGHSKAQWDEDKPLSLFILSSSDISTEELLEKLP